MLMADGWQPAVLQLLPFTPNHAGYHPHPHSATTPSLTPYSTTTHPQPSSASPRFAPSSADVSRGFPVLAVTRKDKAAETGSGSHKGSETARSGGWGGVWAPSPSGGRVRTSSERLVRSQTFVDGATGVSSSSSSSLLSSLHQPRARSEYATPKGSGNGGIPAGGNQGMAKSTGLQSRAQTTCSVADLTDRLIPRMGLRPESSSPDSGAGSLRNSPYLTSAAGAETSGNQNGGGGSARGLPKPAFPANALTPSNTTAAGVIGSGNGGVGEGRCMVSKNGMWRSVTLTPGEMELKKHRDLLERVTTVHSASGKGDSKQYHKLNIRDLPRSTTPVNDHDPDKLNMKQVIAFLQSKGKSQADAVELPRELKTRVDHRGTLPRAIRSGVFKGSVRRPAASSPAAEFLTRSSARFPLMESSDDSPGGAPRTGSGASTLRTSAPVNRNTTAFPSTSSAREEQEYKRGHREKLDHHARGSPSKHRERSDSHAGGSPRKLQKKPFRLHRFLTMVPTAREPAALSSSYLSSAETRPLYSPVPLEHPPSSKSAHKERTLCMDLASQSKAQTSLPRSVDSKAQRKVQYRVTSRPKPSSLRVEQDWTDAQWKLSADFGQDRDQTEKAAALPETRKPTKEKKDVIRLPFVMVDSEDEELAESRKSSKSRKGSQHSRSSRKESDMKQKVKDETPPETGGVDGLWVVDVTEVQEPRPSSEACGTEGKPVPQSLPSPHLSTSSSMCPAAAESSDSVTTVCASDPASDRALTGERDPSLTPPDVLDDPRPNPLPEDSDVRDTNVDVRDTNVDVRDTNVDVRDTSVHVRDTTVDVRDKTIDVRDTTLDVRDTTLDVKDTTLDVRDTTLDVRDKTIDVRDTTLDVRDTTMEKSPTNKKVTVSLPSHTDPPSKDSGVSKPKLPDCVTLSLRKERHRTRESTYMSEIGGSDVFSDDTCAARVNSDSVKLSFRSDDVASFAS